MRQSPDQRHLYTIGYATKPREVFLEQLHRYGIGVVADVRSVPYSRAFHDYHREALSAALQQAGIAYVFLGEELGPRSKDAAHYNGDGQVQFDRLMTSPLYRQGMERLLTGLGRGYAIALCCAEKDAATCHRSLLIGYEAIRHRGLQVTHIAHDGSCESQQDLEKRLPELTGTVADLFTAEDELPALAYRRQLERCAWRRPGAGIS